MIADILGSTAKGAMADTALGLYRERNKAGAVLAVTGRDVEEKEIPVRMDWQSACWRKKSGKTENTAQQDDLLKILDQLGKAGSTELAEGAKTQSRFNPQRITELERKGKSIKMK